MASGVIKQKIEPVLKRTIEGKTFTLTFPKSSADMFAIVFGRFGFDSADISFSIISHPWPDQAYVKNYGTDSIAITCTGDTVTVTTPQVQSNVWIYCPYGIT